MHNRDRMRASNTLVREWLLTNKYDQIWFKPHTARNDVVYTQTGKYLATDLWNLFDGMCLDPAGFIVFLQMKTNAWAKEKPIKDFVKKMKGCYALSFNVNNKLKGCNGKYKVFVRDYQ